MGRFPPLVTFGLVTFCALFIAAKDERQDWLSRREGDRINRFKLDVLNKSYELTDLFKPENAQLYPLAVGGNRKQYAKLPKLKDVELKDFLFTTADSLHPSQVQAIVDRADWSLEGNKDARRAVRPYLAVEQVDADLDDDPKNVFDDDNVPFPVVLRIAKLTGKTPISPTDTFVAVNTSVELHNYFSKNDLEADLNDISSPALTRGQARALASAFFRKHAKDSGSKTVSIPIDLMPGIQSDYFPKMFDSRGAKMDLMREFHKFTDAQKFMAFLTILGPSHLKRHDVDLERIVAKVDMLPELLNYLSPREIARTSVRNKLERTLRNIRPKEKRLQIISDLPKYVVEQLSYEDRWLDTVRGKGPDPATDLVLVAGLNCDGIQKMEDNGKLLDLMEAYNRMRAASPDLKVFPLGLKNCFLRKFHALGQLEGLEKESFIYTLYGRALLDQLGPQVLSGETLSELEIFSNPEYPDDQMKVLDLIRRVGSAPLLDMIPVVGRDKMIQMGEIGSNVAKDLGLSTFERYMTLGSFNHFNLRVGEDEKEIGDLKKFLILDLVDGRKRAVCLGTYARRDWAKALRAIYGPINKWHEEDLYQIGDLMITLSRDDLLSIPLVAFRRAIPYLLEKSSFYDRYDVPPPFSKSTKAYQVCAGWLGGQDGKDFLEAFMNLQRMYLEISQLGVNVALQDEVVRSVPIEAEGQEEVKEDGKQVQKRSIFTPEYSDLENLDLFIENDLRMPSFRFGGDLQDSFDLRAKRQAPFPSADAPPNTAVPNQGIVANAQAPNVGSDPISNAQAHNQAPSQGPPPSREPIKPQAPTEPEKKPPTLGEVIKSRVQVLIGWRRQRGRLPFPVQVKIGQIIADSKDENLRLYREATDSDETVPQAELTQKVQELTADPANFDKVNKLQADIEASRDEMVRNVGAVLEVSPRILELREEIFCRFFTNLCTDGKFEPFKAATPNQVDRADTEVKEEVIQERIVTVDGDLGLPTDFTCDGLRAAGKAAMALSKRDLENWTDNQLDNCLEVIGMIDWDLDTRLEVWDYLKNTDMDFAFDDKISETHALSMGNLIEAIANRDPDYLNLNYDKVDTICAVGKFSYPADVLKTLGLQMKEDSMGVDLPIDWANGTLINTMAIAPMGHLICALDDATLEAIVEDVELFKNVLPNIVKIKSCPNPFALRIIADGAQKLFRSYNSLTPAQAEFLGVFAAGFTPKEMMANDWPFFAALTAEAVAHLPHETLMEVGPEAIAEMKPEAAAVLTKDQIVNEEKGTMISKESADALMAMDKEDLTGLAETLRQFDFLRAETTTEEPVTSTEAEEEQEVLDEVKLQESTAEGSATGLLGESFLVFSVSFTFVGSILFCC